MRLAMILDKRRCYACQGCTVACKQANATPPGTFWTKTIITEHGTYPDVHYEYMPLICNHCDDAPCVKACPTGASAKMADGTVQVDPEKCIGCKACIAACPYEARYYNGVEKPAYYSEVGKQNTYEQSRSKEHFYKTVDKCTFCAPRRAKGLPPACVATCAGQARIFGDLDDPNSEISKLFKKYQPKPMESELGAKPNVFYIESEGSV